MTTSSAGVEAAGWARQAELVNWYLSEIEEDIESVEMLAEKKLLVEKVIERLVQHVRKERRYTRTHTSTVSFPPHRIMFCCRW